MFTEAPDPEDADAGLRDGTIVLAFRRWRRRPYIYRGSCSSAMR